MPKLQACPNCAQETLPVANIFILPTRKVTCYSCGKKFRKHISRWKLQAYSMITQLIYWTILLYYLKVGHSLGTLFIAGLLALLIAGFVAAIPYRFAKLRALDQ